MKRKAVVMLLLLCMSLTACFSYRDINKLLIVVSTIVDVDGDNNVILYLEVFKPYRSEQTAGGKGVRLKYKTSGETILEAIRDLNLGTSQKLNFTQNKILIFTKRAAEKGLDNYIDFLNRDQEFVLRQYLYVFDGDPEELLNIHIPEEEYIGIYLYELPINQGAAGKRFVTRLDRYMNYRMLGNQTNILPMLVLSKNHIDSKLRIHKTAILKDDKFVGELSFDETSIFNLMTGPIRSGTLLLSGADDNTMTLEIVGSKVKNDISYDGERVKLIKNIDIRTTFASTQKPLELLQPAVREQLVKQAEKNVKEKCEKLFNEWKEKGIEIFKITSMFERAYKGEKLEVEDIIEITDLEVNIKVYIEGSTDVMDFVD